MISLKIKNIQKLGDITLRQSFFGSFNPCQWIRISYQVEHEFVQNKFYFIANPTCQLMHHPK